MYRMLLRILFSVLALGILEGCKPGPDAGKSAPVSDNPNKVRVYSHRYYTVDQQLFNQFTASTGIAVEIVRDSDEALLQRLQKEAAQPQADILLASDVVYLEDARKAGLLQPFSSPNMDRNVPSRYRDNQGHWTAIDRGAVGLAYARNRVDIRSLYTYNDLTAPQWRGKLLLGNPAKASNRGLVAGLIASNGEQATAQWLSAILQNRNPAVNGSSDYDLIKAIAAGQAEMAIVPSSTLLQMKASGNPEFATPAKSLGFIFLTHPDRTSVFYVSGAGLVKDAPHRDLAVLLLEFLTNADQQPTLTSATIDYPINPMSLPHEFIDDIGGFYEYPVHLNDAAAQYQAADRLIKAAGWQ